MKKQYELSVCIPTYNQTNYLKRTLDSLVLQTQQGFELIISDDSSTEEVFSLVQNYVSFFGDRIRYVKNTPAFGSPKNWNESIKLATGEYIKILHHDEWLVDGDVLQKMVDLIKKNPTSLVFAGIKGTIVKENRTYVNLPKEEILSSIQLDPFSLIWANVIGPPSTILFKKNDVCFDDRLIWLVDIDFYLQLLLNKHLKLCYLPEVLFENCQDEHNITNQCWQNKDLEMKEFLLIYDKFNANCSYIHKLKFLIKLKKHISHYAKVSFLELVIYTYKKKWLL